MTRDKSKCDTPAKQVRCPNMKCTHEDADGERYRCEVCGESYYLDYDEIK